MNECKHLRFDNDITIKYYDLDPAEQTQKRKTWLLIKMSIEELSIEHFCFGKNKINPSLMFNNK